MDFKYLNLLITININTSLKLKIKKMSLDYDKENNIYYKFQKDLLDIEDYPTNYLSFNNNEILNFNARKWFRILFSRKIFTYLLDLNPILFF